MAGPGALVETASRDGYEQVAVPTQHGVRAYQHLQSAQHVPRQPVRQSGQERPIARLKQRSLFARLPLQDRDLVT
ncbi:hypothetical protein [Micromonospora pisi]|uniref:hypothetical protein n=1 Tax=Micromonospora pisi TaxID=589240 RepID=UPI001B8680CC|nr:hypothetical protein [Micromonospora pisi]